MPFHTPMPVHAPVIHTHAHSESITIWSGPSHGSTGPYVPQQGSHGPILIMSHHLPTTVHDVTGTVTVSGGVNCNPHGCSGNASVGIGINF